MVDLLRQAGQDKVGNGKLSQVLFAVPFRLSPAHFVAEVNGFSIRAPSEGVHGSWCHLVGLGKFQPWHLWHELCIFSLAQGIIYVTASLINHTSHIWEDNLDPLALPHRV